MYYFYTLVLKSIWNFYWSKSIVLFTVFTVFSLFLQNSQFQFMHEKFYFLSRDKSKKKIVKLCLHWSQTHHNKNYNTIILMNILAKVNLKLMQIQSSVYLYVGQTSLFLMSVSPLSNKMWQNRPIKKSVKHVQQNFAKILANSSSNWSSKIVQ